MAKKDKKKSTVDKKARVAEKTARKTAQKEKKSNKKGGGPLTVDADDQDIDAVLEEYARKQAQYHRVTETLLDQPPPVRSGATLTPSPSNASELFLFAGETFNGSLATFFNDLNVYNTATGVWKSITSPNSPLPRSGHWVCSTHHSGGILWLFGGEFSSPKQNTFYHYNDFWSFDCKTREWARVDVKGKAPPARSGHRMVGWKNLIALWGGFQDTSASTKYLGDLWIFNTQSYTWAQVVLPAHAQRPDARSSFSLLPHEQGAVLFGGYSKTKVASAQRKGGKMAVTETGNIHEDSWLLRLDQEDLSKVRWERRKKPGNSPNPKRVGVTMAPHKGRGIMFGGVHDKAETDEGLESVFFADLFAWSVERNRFFPLVLRKPRQQKKAGTEQRGGGRKDRGREADDELFRNLARLEAESAGKSAEEVQEEEERKKAEEEKERLALLRQNELTLQLPGPRMHTALAVQDDVLYIYGGTFEKEDREIFYDEMYAIDLGKLDGVRAIFSRKTEIEWIDSESEDDDDDDDDEDDSEDEEEEVEVVAKGKKPKISEEELEARRAEKAKKKAQAVPTPEAPVAPTTPVEDQEEPEHPAAEDPTPHPRPFESLREFYARTSNDWQQLLINQAEAEGKTAIKTVKELRKEAFATAEEKWWDCREEIRALEDEQEEAGIGEVVNFGDKAGGGGGAGGVGRRR